MRFSGNRLFFFILTLSLCTTTLFSINLDFQANLDKQQLSMDDDLTVTFQVSGENLKENLPFPEPEASTDFKLINKNSNQSVSESVSYIKGRLTRSILKAFTFQFTFKPLKTGDLKVPGFKFEYQDFKRVIAATPVKVGKESPESGDINFSFTFSKPSLYLNEGTILTATIRRKANSSVNEIGLPEIEKELKKFFWIKALDEKWAGSQTRIGNEQYIVYSNRYLVFPVMDGKVKIPSISLQYTVLERRAQRSRDPFFDGFFDNVSTKTKTKYSSPTTIDVKPLPESGKPAGFDGAVGDFKMTASLDKKEVKAGDAVNLKVTLTGRGNEKSVNAVTLRNKERFEVFDPEIQASSAIQNGQAMVTKSFRYVLIPQVEGKQTVGPVVLYFFNPVSGRYDSVEAAPELTVLKGKVSQAMAGRYLSKEEIRQLGQDIRYLKSDDAPIRNEFSRLYRMAFFPFLALLPLGYALLFILFWRHQTRLKNDPEYARLRKAGKQAILHLNMAKEAVPENRENLFYASIEKALTGFIADKLNLPIGGPTAVDIETNLKKRLPNKPELVHEITTLLSNCEMHRFANLSGTRDERQAMYQKSSELIEKLVREL